MPSLYYQYIALAGFLLNCGNSDYNCNFVGPPARFTVRTPGRSASKSNIFPNPIGLCEVGDDHPVPVGDSGNFVCDKEGEVFYKRYIGSTTCEPTAETQLHYVEYDYAECGQSTNCGYVEYWINAPENHTNPSCDEITEDEIWGPWIDVIDVCAESITGTQGVCFW